MLIAEVRDKSISSLRKSVVPVRNYIHPVFKPYIQDNKPFRSSTLLVCSLLISVTHSSLYRPAVTSVPCFNPVRIPASTLPSYMQKVCYTDTSIRSVSASYKSSSTLNSPLSSYQIDASLKTFRTPIT